MPQKTNLNINPYYDDFDKYDNFYRVLFKPGFPIQARELTTLQSILQNQVESFGSHIFKEGSMVIPGNIGYDSEYYSVRINQEHLGIDVGVYATQLVGKRLRGESSGIVAIVDNYLPVSDADEITCQFDRFKFPVIRSVKVSGTKLFLSNKNGQEEIYHRK